MTPSNMTQTDYNGWTNRATWNVALWIGNDPFLNHTARACVEYRNETESPYSKFIRCMINGSMDQTDDNIRWDDETINHDEINEMMFELG